MVTMSKPTANWEKVGDRFYRKVQLYTAVFDQDLELENYVVVGAPYSGAVGRLQSQVEHRVWTLTKLAIYRDEGKLHSYRGTQAAKSSIDIYSCAGKLIRRINVCIPDSGTMSLELTFIVG
jgi:vacuolar protein sorting-associated protein 16